MRGTPRPAVRASSHGITVMSIWAAVIALVRPEPVVFRAQSVQLSARRLRARYGARRGLLFLLVVSTLALLVKWTHWNSYGETILKRLASCG